MILNTTKTKIAYAREDQEREDFGEAMRMK